MKRPLLIIAVFLLLGAVVNVAVAWGLAFSMRFGADGSTKHVGNGLSAPDAPCWVFIRMERFGSVAIIGTSRDAVIGDVAYGHRPDLVPSWSRLSIRPSAERRRTIEDARGWPLLTLSCAYTGVAHVPGFTVIDGIEVKRHPVGATVRSISLPLRPIWPGFAINTIFYAAILWLVIPGPFVLRRVLRVRRGLCPKCAYPMGESAVCTECGKPLATRAVRREPVLIDAAPMHGPAVR